ncbi:hypothetical protein CLAIMM_14389 [Cladophialophora immunda]|nr:hypothetical protein CLAIMM_14389 [Cladophialophora immunda]
MAAGVAEQDTSGARKGHDTPGLQQVKPDRSSRKRHRSAQDEDEGEEATERQRKSRRIQENSNRRRQQTRRASPKTSRKSPRPQEKQAANQQRTTRGGQTRSSQRPAVKQYHRSEEKDKDKYTASPAELGAPESTKRRRCVNIGDESSHDRKRPRHRLVQHTQTRTRPDKEGFVENWLDESCWSRRTSTENEPQLPGALVNMPRKPAPILPSPDNSFGSTTSTSRKSEKSAASVHDPDYHQSLRYRNIFIERENPPQNLLQRAHRIISRSRASPEMDDATVQKLKDKSRRLRNEAEDVIIKQLAPHIIPAMDEITRAAFTEKQLMTIDLLVDDQFGRSYAIPDQKVRFPFLEIEFKSQAKNGTHYIAINQAAGAGAIALNGNMDLTQRSFGMDKFDYEEPQYFSVTMDHQLACINVHWLGAPVEGGQHSFHVEGLSQHLLRDENGIRAVSRAIKNILDWGADPRLRALCEALDAYRETVVRNREAANAQRKQEREVLSEPQTEFINLRNYHPPSRPVSGLSRRY